MDRRHLVRVVANSWTVAGTAVSFGALPAVNADARALVVLAAILGGGSAVAASTALARGRDRVAGVLLVASAVVTPTFYVYVLNLVPLIVGTALLTAPRPTWTTRTRPISP